MSQLRTGSILNIFFSEKSWIRGSQLVNKRLHTGTTQKSWQLLKKNINVVFVVVIIHIRHKDCYYLFSGRYHKRVTLLKKKINTILPECYCCTGECIMHGQSQHVTPVFLLHQYIHDWSRGWCNANHSAYAEVRVSLHCVWNKIIIIVILKVSRQMLPLHALLEVCNVSVTCE